jgi:hypothetical protein
VVRPATKKMQVTFFYGKRKKGVERKKEKKGKKEKNASHSAANKP